MSLIEVHDQYCFQCALYFSQKMDTAVMNLHSLFGNLRSHVDILNESIEPRT